MTMEKGDGTDYEVALHRLFQRTGGAWRLGLERVTELLGRLGNPHLQYPIFHVAGTNGKGSTVATLDALLRGSGKRVGKYTSPHLVDFAERIIVDGAPMAHSAIAQWLNEHEPLLTELGATFFEATTAMALSHFAAQSVEVAIVEVGLGGRLDATNVVQPLAAGVTQIGYDHVEYLGDTLEAIAGEKAGIFKNGSAAVVGEIRPDLRDLLRERAQETGAQPVFATGIDWQVDEIEVSGHGTAFTLTENGRSRRLMTPLIGRCQAHNASVALAMLRGAGGEWAQIEREASRYLPMVHIAGRFHRTGPWLFDVAHNPDGAATVVSSLLSVGAPKPLAAVVCVLGDKDWRGILSALSRSAVQLFATMAPTAPASRAWNLDEVMEWASAQSLPVVRSDDFGEALRLARDSAATVLVTGSFHTVGDAMERLQVDPLAR